MVRTMVSGAASDHQRKPAPKQGGGGNHCEDSRGPTFKAGSRDFLMKARSPFSNHRPLDPRICNIALDANALDLGDTEHDRLVTRFRDLSDTAKLNVVLGGGVRGEV